MLAICMLIITAYSRGVNMVKIKTVAYKQTLRTIASYEKKLGAGKVYKSERIESYKRSMSHYVDLKTGKLKAGLSEKQKANFNKKVTAFKETTSVQKLEADTKRRDKKFIENHAGATSATVMNMKELVTMSNSKKIKIDSDKIVELAFEMEENKGVSSKEWENLFKEYLKRIDKGVPFEAKDYVGTDDVVKIMQDLSDIMAKLNTTKDKNKLLNLIKQNKTIEEIEKYFEENGIEEKKKAVTSKRGKATIVTQKEVASKTKKPAVKASKGSTRITQRKGKKKSLNGVVR